MDFVVALPNEIIPALVIVVCAILVDVVLGVFLKIRNSEFKVELLPKFLLTGVLPYVGGLILLGLMAEFVGVFFVSLFYVSATAVIAKYVMNIKTKITDLFIK